MKCLSIPILLVLPLIAAAEVEPEWSFFPGYYSPGKNGIVIADIDNDGHMEAIITGNSSGGFDTGPNNHLATLKYVGDRFLTTSLLPVSGTFSGRLQAVAGTGGESAVVAAMTNDMTGETDIVTFSGHPLREIRRVSAPAYFALYQIADVDGDGELEALGLDHWLPFYSEGAPTLLKLSTGAIEWAGEQPAEYIGAGQLDGDPSLEIVLGNSGTAGRILDGSTRVQQWSYPDGFNGWPVFGNFRGTAEHLEFAVVEPWGPTKIYVTHPIFSPVDEIDTGQVGAHSITDVNNDGIDDLVIGQGQWGSVAVYSMDNGQLLHSHENPEYGVSAVAAADLDGFPGMELIYGAGLLSSSDLLRVLDASSGDVKYDSYDEGGPHSSILLSDLDGDGSVRVIFATDQSNFSIPGPSLIVLDSETGLELRRRVNVFDRGNSAGISLRDTDLEGDGAREIIVGSGRSVTAEVAVIDGQTLEDRWRVQLNDTTQYVSAMELIRLNGDEIDDIVVATGERIHILDGLTGAQLFRSVSFSQTFFPTLAVGNTDADPQHEVSLSTGENIFIIDPVTGLVESAFSTQGTVIGQRIESNGGVCSLVAVFQDRLERLECSSGAVNSSLDFGRDVIYVGFPTDSHGPLVLSDVRHLIRRENGVDLAVSSMFDISIGVRNRGVVTSLAGNEIEVFTGGMHGVHRLVLPEEESMFESGFESDLNSRRMASERQPQ